VRKSDEIYQLIRRDIVRLAVAPGAPLSEKELGQRFGASRTPVHEALKRLAEERLVKIVPQSGTFVRRLSSKTAEEGFIIRRALEIEGIRRAASRITDPEIAALDANLDEMRLLLRTGRLAEYIDVDDQFHALIAHASGLRNIWRFIDLAKVHLDRLRHLSTPVPGHLERVTEQHASILEALRARDPDRCELSLRVHLDSSYMVMSRLAPENADLFLTEDEDE